MITGKIIIISIAYFISMTLLMTIQDWSIIAGIFTTVLASVGTTLALVLTSRTNSQSKEITKLKEDFTIILSNKDLIIEELKKTQKELADSVFESNTSSVAEILALKKEIVGLKAQITTLTEQIVVLVKENTKLKS